MGQHATFPDIEFPHLANVELPQVIPVRLNHRLGTPVADIDQRTRQVVRESRQVAQLVPGSRVAIGIGSRGIASLVEVVTAAVSEIQSLGHTPFIVPAMGSHGGGTAEGQEAVLAKLGITKASVGAPVHATMDVIEYGKTVEGIECKFDRNAAEADSIIIINRIKSHTTFDRPIESGLTKMIAVGLGKAEGARRVHKLGPRGLSEVLPNLAQIALDNAPITLGIGLVENANKDIVHLEGVEPDTIMATDERLLREAKSYLPRLPITQADVLIVERSGKEISGTGMDFAITGRTDIRGIDNPATPFIHKLGLLNLTQETAGNAVGIGMADFTTRAAAEAIDFKATYMNALTATLVDKSRIPIVLPTERDVIAAAVTTSWTLNDADARFCMIATTLHLDQVMVSPALLDDIPDGMAEPIGPPQALQFNAQGELITSLWHQHFVTY